MPLPPYRAYFRRLVTVTIVALGLFGAQSALAGEWPQVLGPHRNGVADNESLARQWPSGGPKIVWRRPVGGGYAGPAVAGGRAIIFHRVGDEEVVEAFEAATGKSQWRTAFQASYVATITPDNGPRCVPLIHDGHVFLYGAAGDLHCLDANTGKRKWSRALGEEYEAPAGYFGAGATPIIEGDRILVNVGGQPAAGVVALSLHDGRTLWTATGEQASYSAPTATTLGGARHVIFVTRYHVVSLNPNNGDVRFQFPFGQRGPTVNAATPLVVGSHLFVSASYGVGAVWAKLTDDDALVVWRGDDVMSSQYATCVAHEGYLYGVDGREDAGVARLRCFDPRSGEVQWTEDGFGMATLILADDQLLIMKTDGQLVLADAASRAYRERARHRVFSDTARALPALADGRYYVRDTLSLVCLDLR